MFRTNVNDLVRNKIVENRLDRFDTEDFIHRYETKTFYQLSSKLGYNVDIGRRFPGVIDLKSHLTNSVASFELRGLHEDYSKDQRLLVYYPMEMTKQNFPVLDGYKIIIEWMY